MITAKNFRSIEFLEILFVTINLYSNKNPIIRQYDSNDISNLVIRLCKQYSANKTWSQAIKLLNTITDQKKCEFW